MANLPDAFPQVYMGFVGFVRLHRGTINGDNTVNPGSNVSYPPYIIRATTANINLSQDITKPDTVDSRYDKTVYQLGPKLIDGTLEFPAIYDSIEDEIGIFETLYRLAVTRGSNGSLTRFDMDVKYATSEGVQQADFTYNGNIINTWQFSVTQGELVTCNIGIIGTSRKVAGILPVPTRNDSTTVCDIANTNTDAGSIGTSRVVTWADARVNILGERLGSDTITGKYIRTFEANVNNDAERFYTLNKSLFAQDIAARKRDVDGSLTIVGRHSALAELARSNEDQCNESTQLKFGYEVSTGGEACTNVATFAVTLPNCVFHIEEMSLSNDIFESSIDWLSLPSAGTGVCDPLLYNIGSGTTFE